MVDLFPAAAISGRSAFWPRILQGRLVRYALAAIGPVSASATQFILSLVILRLVALPQFGVFTFLLVASQLSWGAWSALFCAPLPVLLATRCADDQAEGEVTLLAVSLIGAISALPLFALMAALLKLHLGAIACFAGYGSFTLIRLVARAYAYVHGRQLRTVLSDVTYSIGTLLMLAVGLLIFRWEAQSAAYAALLVGTALGLAPFGIEYARRQFAPFGLSELRRYGAIWQTQARWALLGVLTTEATANAHVYLLTLFDGPRAFAPIAASALLMRPVNVAQSALADFEKPQMARFIAERNWDGLLTSKRWFFGTLVVVWIASALAAWALFSYNARLVFSKSYDLKFVAIAAIFWLFVAAIRLAQVPPSTALGAAGEFRSLALASIWSSIASLILTAVLIIVAGALWSILGVAAGAGLFLIWTERSYRLWLKDAAGLEG